MILQRHPEVAGQLVDKLEGFPDTLFLDAAAGAARSLTGVMGFASCCQPPWLLSSNSSGSGSGWALVANACHEGGAASRVDRMFRDVDLFSRLDDPGIALLRSQGGPGAAWQCPRAPLVASQRWNFSCLEFSFCVVCSFPSL